jgi:aconitate hydratase
LSPKPWVKTSLALGSPTAAKFLSRAGVLEDLEALGFSIVGYGCTTCIGNSGELTDRIVAAAGTCRPVAVISGNRNFPGRIHPNLEDGFLASPPLVVAFALAGDVDRDILVDPIGSSPDGQPIHLSEIWPSNVEIDAMLTSSSNPKDYPTAFLSATSNEQWDRLAAPESDTFPWDPDSTYIRRPPFVKWCPDKPSVISNAAPLVVLGDDITTDHISPAGAILTDSEAGRHLTQCGEHPSNLNVFAARRGNWEAMLRGILTNRTVCNLLGTGIPPGHTLYGPSGKVLPIWKAAERFRNEGIPVVVFAGDRYGMGSSRDWAAKGLALLGVKAVLSTSFERIHRTNLIGMGILPLRLPAEQHPETLCLSPHDRISIQADIHQIKPRSQVSVSIRRASGRENHLMVRLAVETSLESELLQAGGMLPFILEETNRSLRKTDFQGEERSHAYP